METLKKSAVMDHHPAQDNSRPFLACEQRFHGLYTVQLCTPSQFVSSPLERHNNPEKSH